MTEDGIFPPLKEAWSNWLVLALVVFILFVLAGYRPTPEQMELQFQPWTIPLVFALLIGVILVDIIHDRMTYTYISDDTRIHKKTGQKQGHINVWTGFGRAKGWVNMKTEDNSPRVNGDETVRE